MANPTKAERRAAWKASTTASASALKSAGATVSAKTGKRSIPLSAVTPEQIRVAAWKAEHPDRYIVGEPVEQISVKTGKTTLTPLGQQMVRQAEQDAKTRAFFQIPTYDPVKKAITEKQILEAAKQRVITVQVPAKLSFVERHTKKMEDIGIKKPGKITTRIASGQEKAAAFFEERKTTTAALGLQGLPASKMIGAIGNVVQMFSSVPRAAEMAWQDPGLIAPGAAILAHSMTVGTVKAFKEDPIQTTMEFALMGKALHMTQVKVSGTAAKLPVKFGVEKVEGYRGAYVDIKGQVKPVVGVEGGKIKLGEPTTLKPSAIKDMRPESPLQTHMIETTIKEHFSASDLKAFQSARNTIYQTQYQAAGKGATFPEGTKSLSPEGTKVVLDFAKKNNAEVYGSFATEGQVPKGVRRVPGDMDLQLTAATQAEAVLNTQSLLRALKAKGEPVRISSKSPTLIESYTKGEWHHAVDLHFTVKGEYIAPARSGLLGYGMDKPLIEVSGIKAMGLTEQVIRKGESAVRPHEPGYLVKAKGEAFKEVGIGPEAHRIKDIHDFVRYQDVLIDTMEGGVFGVLRRGKVTKARSSLTEFKDARKMFFDEVIDPSTSIKVLMQKAKPSAAVSYKIKPSIGIVRASPAAVRAYPSKAPSRPPSRVVSLPPSMYITSSPSVFYQSVSVVYGLISVPPSPPPSSGKPYIKPSPVIPPYLKTSPVIPPYPKTPVVRKATKAAPKLLKPKTKTDKKKKKRQTRKGVRSEYVVNPVPSLSAFLGSESKTKTAIKKGVKKATTRRTIKKKRH